MTGSETAQVFTCRLSEMRDSFSEKDPGQPSASFFKDRSEMLTELLGSIQGRGPNSSELACTSDRAD